jgi:peptidoglycan/LPS O-acetylase OafA/YrhL
MGAARNRIDYLDGIRALAILSVVALHWTQPESLPVLKGGYIGVDLFLVLSGYLISRILWRSKPGRMLAVYGGFLKRRFLRLYPALLGMLAVVTPLAFLAWGVSDGMKAAYRAVLAALQLTSVVAVLNLGSTTPFEQTWTLGWEWYFYLGWPLVLLAVRGRGVSALRVAVWSAVVGVALYLLSAVFMSAAVMYYGPLGRFSQLLLGSALGLLFLARPEPLRIGRGVRGVLMGSAVALFVAWTVFGPTEHDRLYGVLGFPLATLCGLVLVAVGYRREGDTVPRALSWAPVRSVGLWSYSIYLWHLPLLRIVQGPKFGVPSPLAVLAVAVATVVLSWLSYRFLEKRFLVGREPVREGAPSHREGTPAR